MSPFNADFWSLRLDLGGKCFSVSSSRATGGDCVFSPHSSRLCLFHYVLWAELCVGVSLGRPAPVKLSNRILRWRVRCLLSRGYQRLVNVFTAQSSPVNIRHRDFLLTWSAVRTGHVRTSATIIRQNISNQDSTCLTIPPLPGRRWITDFTPDFYYFSPAVQAINL